jgi:DNA-binding LacI/PurR family transcriptional regulator
VNRPKRRLPVIADVARVAGVSIPTVSRVLTGSTPVSEAKRAQVMEAIQVLGYRPNGAARALVSGRQPIIAVLAGNTSMYGYAMTIAGIEEAARQSHYIVVIGVVETDADEDVDTAIDLILSQPVAGVIVLAFDSPGQAALARLPEGIPAVSAGAFDAVRPSVPHARLDDAEGAARATSYLLELGHRTVYHVAIPPSGRVSGRSLGWKKALDAVGAPVPMLQSQGWTPRDGYACGRGLVELPGVTAVLCGNDELAIGVMRALQDAGRRVPEDISLVGFDGQPIGAFVKPALTTVEQDFTALGRCALHMLSAQIATGDSPELSTTSARLVVRESSGPPPA